MHPCKYDIMPCYGRHITTWDACPGFSPRVTTIIVNCRGTRREPILPLGVFSDAICMRYRTYPYIWHTVKSVWYITMPLEKYTYNGRKIYENTV